MFLERLLELCNEKGTTITKTLKSIGLTASKGTAWRDGSVPNGIILSKLAAYFGVSTDYLLGETDIKNRPSEMDSLSPEIISILNRIQKLSPDNLSKLSELIDLYLSGQDSK